MSANTGGKRKKCHEVRSNEIKVLVFQHYHTDFRVNGIKKLLRRRTFDVELLKKRLDKHGDNWRAVPMVAPQPKGKPEQKRRGPKPKNKQASTETTAETPQTDARKQRKQRVKKQQPDASAVPTTPQQILSV